MNLRRPPRVPGLILALVAVLILMGYAFWRAAARSGAPDTPQSMAAADEAVPAAATAASAAMNDMVPSPAPRALAGGPGGQPATAKTPTVSPAATPPPANEKDEAHLMARLRAIKDSDPAGAVTLARDGNSRFADSADAPERTSILIHALVAVDKGSEARGEAEQMVNHYPDSSWVREVEHFTGAHRHRNVSLDDGGQPVFR